MEIIKYEKKSNGNYLIYFDNNTKIKIHEDIILKYKLLYKKEIDEFLLQDIIQDNNNYNIYDKCVKYISIRLRSINEIKEYMHRLGVDNDLIDATIDRLLKNKLLDDEIFTKAFINDKFNFTTMGPYRIYEELKKQKIDDKIINKYLNEIDDNLIEDKLNKQIAKIIKSNKNKPNLKNKIYHNLLNLGYSNESIVANLNKYDV